MKKILFGISVLLCTLAYSQQKKFNITWNTAKALSTGGSSITVPDFSPKEHYNFSFSNGVNFVAQWETNSNIKQSSVTLTNVKYVTISKLDLKDLDLKTIPSSIEYSLENTQAREDKYAFLTVSAIVKTGSNSYKKVTSFTVNYENSSSSFRTSNSPPISNSILSSGTWYKFGINKTGVFKLSKNFLNSLGINTNSIDPRGISVYGNGGKMIPYLNNDSYPIDPVENAIKVVGEEDGVFNDGDYVMFYGVGPEGIVDDPLIGTNINAYQDITYYYINIGFGSGKRIQNMMEPSGNVTTTISTFQDYQFHEVDEFNLAFVGRRWFGDELDIETTKTFDFNFPNLITTEPVKFVFNGASTSGSDANWTVSVNSDEVATITTLGISGDVYGVGAYYANNVSVTSDNINVKVDYDKLGVPSAVGYVDYISIEATRSLEFNGNQFQFFNRASAQASGVGMYTLTNASNVSEIWEITDANNITNKLNTETTLNFNANLGSLKKYIAVTTLDLYEPIKLGTSSVVNQNIKGTIFENSQGDFQDIDYVMVTPRSHLGQANRLAQINRDQNNLNVKVVTLESIYNEFSTGNRDIAAIRNLVKYVYDNASSPDKRLKYLCLFGDSSFDYKSRISSNTYNTPSWHAYNSYLLTDSYVSDDFYGMMDPNEGTMVAADRLDIAVGRILADSPERAKEMVDKVAVYYSNEAFGSWRNNFIAISDDVDAVYESILQETTDEISDEITAAKPFLNAIKIHADSYQQQASAGGDRYPGVATAIANAIENGALVVNYFGHGGEDGWAFERLFQKPDVQALRNDCKLACFVTVTCEYTRFDNPFRVTAGELVYWNKNGGAISLISTTRQIFVSVGVEFNIKLEEYLFSYNDSDSYADHEYPSMAEALRLTKNSNSIAGIGQKYLVFYIGDPALKLAFPKPNVKLTKINDMPVAGNTEVLEALSYTKLSGEVTDVAGNVLTNYNGKVETTIYDKPIQRETLANDNTYDGGELIKLEYETLGEVIFRGQSTVTNGEFEFDFIVPRDIGIPVGFGKINFYASTENPVSDQSGGDINILQIGGINENAAEDNLGPNINLYMNDENFVSGGITNESPTLLVKLQDENGINTASGIGHDIVALLDGDEVNPYVLNNYYVTELDDYTRGGLSYPFRELEPGLHTLTVKAWDVYNNSSTAELQFRVFDEKQSLVIENVLNYPNPFVNYTEFWFSHNSSEVLDVSVQIFTVSGKIVRTLNGQTTGVGTKSTSSTSRDIVWDGRDDFGDKIGKGTYVYKLKVHSSATNKTVEKIEKLVIL
ncbi:type IX secretion system sortase PorU [Lacinutrix sp. Bg11-31]|uniref:type IX secretion system sortase PorU n=1 Tax=Lacinutrix sp. Bg11-31 TaxID=2057808 RepID=UPI000C31A4F0|nr:type IX secretion system sortase PorU [Lacinutrix sp. Bg11-31]AUC80617.1 peptidase C25 [Lacinutrix sp. Bg11-31]